jgi:two-component system NtrC family sensor kinase
MQRVFVIDDDPSVCEVLGSLLETAGYAVETATNAQTALGRLQDHAYGCLLVDLRMPGMTGFEFYQAVKQQAPALARRIVFCTGELLEGHVRWFLEGTGAHLLLKPVRATRLLEVCGEVCGRREDQWPGMASSQWAP